MSWTKTHLQATHAKISTSLVYSQTTSTYRYYRSKEYIKLHIGVTEAHQVLITSITRQQTSRQNKWHSSSLLCGTSVSRSLCSVSWYC